MCLSRHCASFVATKHVFCRDKSMIVATKVWLSRQTLVATSTSAPLVCRDKSFVTANIFLSRQKTCFVATKQKRFFVAAPATDANQPWLGSQSEHLSLRSLRKYPRASMLGHLPLVFAREGENWFPSRRANTVRSAWLKIALPTLNRWFSGRRDVTTHGTLLSEARTRGVSALGAVCGWSNQSKGFFRCWLDPPVPHS